MTTYQIIRPASHDDPHSALGKLDLLQAKANLSADMALTEQDRRFFREIAKDAGKVRKAIQREQARRDAA